MTFTNEQLDDLAYRCGKGWVIHHWEIRILLEMVRQSEADRAGAAACDKPAAAYDDPYATVPKTTAARTPPVSPQPPTPAPDPWPYGAPYPWNQRTP
jgi:hypothetical protein